MKNRYLRDFFADAPGPPLAAWRGPAAPPSAPLEGILRAIRMCTMGSARGAAGTGTGAPLLMTTEAVHWHEGMFLRPHHLQAAGRHEFHRAHVRETWDQHHYWGLREI